MESKFEYRLYSKSGNCIDVISAQDINAACKLVDTNKLMGLEHGDLTLKLNDKTVATCKWLGNVTNYKNITPDYPRSVNPNAGVYAKWDIKEESK